MKILTLILTQFLLIFNAYSQSNINNHCVHKPDTLDGQEVYKIVEVQPEYKGGSNKFYYEFSEIIKYTWKKDDITDTKYFYTFVIDTTGNIRNFCTIKPKGITVDEEKLKKLNNWTPGTQRGKKVPVRIIIPVIVEPG